MKSAALNHINKTILDNGLTVVTEQVSFYKSASIGVWVKTGSRYETRENMGIVHFIEHMLFKGTHSRSAMEIASSIEDLGGSINAFTGKEETCFYIHVLDTHIKEGIEILGDMISNSVFDIKDIKTEKQVVLEEIKAVKDTPDEYVFDLLQEKVFPNDPLGYPILGNSHNVKKISYDQIKEFIMNHYTPQNIVISAAGNLNHHEIVNWVSANFDLVPDIKKPQIIETKMQPGVNFVKYKNLNQAHICIASEGCSYSNEERFNLVALNAFLGNGLSSKLFQVLREELGLVYSVYSFLDFYLDTGMVGFYLGTDQRNIEKAVSCLKNELKKLSDTFLPDHTISNLKEQIKGNLFLSLESTFKRMTRIAKNEIYYNRYISSEELVQKINNISSESVCKAARKFLNTSMLSSVSLSPVQKNA